jgi:hypothetical protein
MGYNYTKHSRPSEYALIMAAYRVEEEKKFEAQYDTKVIAGSTKEFQSLSLSYPKKTTLDQATIDKVVAVAQNLECYVNRGFGGSSESFFERYNTMTSEIKQLRDQNISFMIIGAEKKIPSYNF